MNILVRKLARTTTEEQIRALFLTHGDVTSCDLVLDKVTGKSKGFAFVDMPNEEEAKSAVDKLNQFVLEKSSIRVKFADSEST